VRFKAAELPVADAFSYNTVWNHCECKPDRPYALHQVWLQLRGACLAPPHFSSTSILEKTIRLSVDVLM